MALRASTLILLSALHVFCHTADPNPLSPPSGWFARCRSSLNSSMAALEVLPGGGWDNLRNLDMGRVMDFSYQQCQTTEDGFYFVPDDVFVLPWKVTNLETYAEVFTSWQDHRSSTSLSINVGGSFTDEDGELHGKFSTELQRVKNNHVSLHSSTTRVQVRNRIYTVKAKPDFRLDPVFVQQVENIADAITDYQFRLASYLCEKLVADYGTHVITSVDAGAALVKEDYVESSFVSSGDRSMVSIKASAGYNFFGLFSIHAGVGFNRDTSEQNAYDNSITSSFMDGYGGSPYYPGMSLSRWQESTRNNLVAIDRSGLPLHYVINTNTLPHLPEPVVSQVAVLVQHAVQRYYFVNTHPGCLDYTSPNFNFQANIDDGSCQGIGTESSLGGVFQTCNGDSKLCHDVPQTNPDTDDYTCSSLYQQTLLHTEERVEIYSERECTQHEHSCGFLWLSTCHEERCDYIIKYRRATVFPYWCYSSNPTNDGFLFGGFYGKAVKNPITKRRSCPPHFNSIQFLSSFTLCLSKSYEHAEFVMPFGGFFSCASTNPATGHNDCPPQFRQHLLTVTDNGCGIHYCAMSDEFIGEQLLSIRLPPFTTRPVRGLQSNNHRIRVMREGNQSWVNMGQSRSWTRTATGDIQDAIETSAAESVDVSGQQARLGDVSGQNAGIGLGVISLVISLIVGVVHTVMWKKGLRQGKKRSHEGEGGNGEVLRVA